MVSISLAYTAPVNPEGSSPVLTEAQVWAGLQRKVRHAEEFVPVIAACQVTKEDGDTIERQVTFLAEDGSRKEPIREVCVHFPPVRVDFKQDDGSNISNIVSKGSEGELLMTYAFEWGNVGVNDANSDEGKKLRAQYEKVSDFFPILLLFLLLLLLSLHHTSLLDS